MTMSDLRFDVVEDATRPNQHLKPVAVSCARLSAVLWTTAGNHDVPEKRVSLLERVLVKLEEIFQNRELWLFAAYSGFCRTIGSRDISAFGSG